MDQKLKNQYPLTSAMYPKFFFSSSDSNSKKTFFETYNKNKNFSSLNMCCRPKPQNLARGLWVDSPVFPSWYAVLNVSHGIKCVHVVV